MTYMADLEETDVFGCLIGRKTAEHTLYENSFLVGIEQWRSNPCMCPSIKRQSSSTRNIKSSHAVKIKENA
jgi:hypothetical protein